MDRKDYKQDYFPERFDLLEPLVLEAVAEKLGWAASVYGEGNWKTIPIKEHMNHAIRHMLLESRGDQSEDHVVNGICRLMFVWWMKWKEEHDQETRAYQNPPAWRERLVQLRRAKEEAGQLSVDRATEEPRGSTQGGFDGWERLEEGEASCDAGDSRGGSGESAGSQGCPCGRGAVQGYEGCQCGRDEPAWAEGAD